MRTNQNTQIHYLKYSNGFSWLLYKFWTSYPELQYSYPALSTYPPPPGPHSPSAHSSLLHTSTQDTLVPTLELANSSSASSSQLRQHLLCKANLSSHGLLSIPHHRSNLTALELSTCLSYRAVKLEMLILVIVTAPWYIVGIQWLSRCMKSLSSSGQAKLSTVCHFPCHWLKLQLHPHLPATNLSRGAAGPELSIVRTAVEEAGRRLLAQPAPPWRPSPALGQTHQLWS